MPGGPAPRPGDSRPGSPGGPAPLPGDFRLRFAPGARRVGHDVLIGGAPLRVLRLTPAGARLLDRWSAGSAVGKGRGPGVLAARLVEAGIAAPVPPGTTDHGQVAVVIPVRDDASGLDATVASIRRTAPGTEVLVVDDGSQPPIAIPEGVSSTRRRVCGGPAAARNTGWRQVEAADIVVFIDAGCCLRPGWIDRLLAHFADPAVAAAAPRVTASVPAGTPRRLAAYEQARSPLDMGDHPAAVVPGGAVPYVPSTVLAVRRRDLEGAGGFDEALRFGEDVDLVWRLHASGHRVIYEPAAAASHPVRMSWTAWLRQRHGYGTSAAPLAARHGRAVAPLAASPWSTAAWLLATAGHPVAGAALAGGSAVALGRRAGADRALGGKLARLALTGTFLSGGQLAAAVRRAWLPPAVGAAAMAWPVAGPSTRRRIVAGGLAIAFWPGPGPKLTSPAVRLADDLAYQSGVWTGVVRARSLAALLPRW